MARLLAFRPPSNLVGIEMTDHWPYVSVRIPVGALTPTAKIEHRIYIHSLQNSALNVRKPLQMGEKERNELCSYCRVVGP
ncbi:hypothetical protein ACH3XW_42715 [Acanthocheilonema viteae]